MSESGPATRPGLAELPALAGPIVLAERAGALLLALRRAGLRVEAKADDSPVTEADRAAEALILEGLRGQAPAIPVVAEEEVAAGRVPRTRGRPFWLVDPLDGTREFVAGRDAFTVNIGLIVEGCPVAGVLFAPALGRLWWGEAGQGAFVRDREGTRQVQVRRPPAPPVVLASRSHLDAATRAYLQRIGCAAPVRVGSSLKFALIASGEADLYPRFGPTMEWDTAAGDAILRAAGGSVTTEEGQPLTYGKEGFRNPGFVARGG